MGRFSEIIVRNKIYSLLLFCLVAINLMVLADRFGDWSIKGPEVKAEVAGQDENQELLLARKKIFDPAEVEARQRQIEAMAEEKPLLYFLLLVVNLAIFFVILIGLIIDFILLFRWRKGEKLDIGLARTEKPLWGPADVLRVVIIFLSAGYIFAFLQGRLSGAFPIFKDINFRIILDTAFLNIIGVSVIFYFVFKKYGQKAAAMGLSKVNAAKAFVTAGVGYAAIVPVMVGVMILTFIVVRLIKYEPPLQPIVEVFMLEKKVSVLWATTLFAAIFGPIAEEIFFRGFMYPALKKKWGMAAGIIVTSVIFSFLHAHMVGFVPIMLLGVFFVYLYERTGSLLVPIAVHVIHNVAMVVMVFLMRALVA